jgi:uncharacterized protein YndB with AHSA1/START domain
MNDVAANQTSDREIVVSRVIDASRELVWSAWRDPESITHWWGPRGFSTTTEKMDFRPGGQWVFVMHGPDGKDYPNTVTYVEVEEPERLIYKHSGNDAAHQVKFDAVVTFERRGSKTELTLRLVFDTVAARNVEVERGALEGGRQTLQRLEERTAMAPGSNAFVISRSFDAPRDLIWKVWTEREHLKHWWGPKGFKVRACDVDLRPGGTFHYCLETPQGEEMWGKFLFREIAAPERLIFLTSFSDPQQGLQRHPMNPGWPLQILSVVTFEEAAGKTTITVHWLPYEATEAEREVFEAGRPSMQAGWTGTCDQLENYLASL